MSDSNEAPPTGWCAPNGRLDVSVCTEPIAHVLLDGVLDVSTCDDFGDYARNLAPEQEGWLLVEASKLTMLSSSGAGTLIRLASQYVEQGGGLALVVPPGDVRQAIHFMRLDLVIDTFDSVEDAVHFINDASKVA